jgi:hypothetical protein
MRCVITQGRSQLFQDGIQLGGLGGVYGIQAKLANAVFQTARPGVRAEATAEERADESSWRIHYLDFGWGLMSSVDVRRGVSNQVETVAAQCSDSNQAVPQNLGLQFATGRPNSFARQRHRDGTQMRRRRSPTIAKRIIPPARSAALHCFAAHAERFTSARSSPFATRCRQKPLRSRPCRRRREASHPNIQT